MHTFFDLDGAVVEYGTQKNPKGKPTKEERKARKDMLAGMTKKQQKQFRRKEKKQRAKARKAQGTWPGLVLIGFQKGNES
jgi:hypothetical protein